MGRWKRRARARGGHWRWLSRAGPRGALMAAAAVGTATEEIELARGLASLPLPHASSSPPLSLTRTLLPPIAAATSKIWWRAAGTGGCSSVCSGSTRVQLFLGTCWSPLAVTRSCLQRRSVLSLFPTIIDTSDGCKYYYRCSI